MRLKVNDLWLAGSLIVLAACASGGLKVDQAVVQIPGKALIGGSAAGYLVIHNGGPDDQLTGAAVDFAQTVEIHATEIQNNVASMRAVDAVAVPAGGEVRLAPGGTHLMLMGLTRVLQPGETVTLRLRFERAGELSVAAAVRAP